MATAIDVTLERESRSEGEYREALEIMRDENRRLARTVEDMFTLARADAGRYPIRTSRFYLDEVVSEAGRAAALLGRGRRVEVATEPGPEAVFTGDEGLVRQMVMNLLDNAIKHTPEGGRVWLAAERRDGEYLVTVGDTGGGIPEESRARVFERFFRVDRARARAESASSGGAGLGLPIARWIAEAHGGRLELVRSSPEGSEFRVALPTGPSEPR
jgi:signal transduction histidine kinase